MTQKFAWMQGAKRVIAVDYLDYRMNYAKRLTMLRYLSLQNSPIWENI